MTTIFYAQWQMRNAKTYKVWSNPDDYYHFVIQRLETGLHINRLYKRPRTYKTRDDCANPYVVKRENTLAKETLCITT